MSGSRITISHKIAAGLLLVHRTPSIRSKLSVLGQLTRVALHPKLGRPDGAPSVSADAWAEYHLLSFVNRDINVRLQPDQPPRIWFVVPDLNASVIFGGYIALFQFINFVQSLGYETAILVLGPIGDKSELLKSFEDRALIHKVITQSHLERVGISRTIRLNPDDMVVSYNWTTSLVAARMVRFLDDKGYYYFVQEDERIFYANDSRRFLAESVFHQQPRPRLICNSSKLLQHLQSEGLVYPDSEVAVFEQGLPAAVLPDRATLSSRSPRRFVFYGRPEEHAKRNLMTIALMALARAKRCGAFDAEPWEFFMIGSPKMGESFELDGLRITCLPNKDYESYRQTLATFDLGMSLMYAPHPSVPPFEMVRSGVVTVVNIAPGRPAEWYRSLTSNFEPGEPTVDGLAGAIGRAAKRVGDVDARLSAARTYHPESWHVSFAHVPGMLSHRLFRAKAELAT
ncbi:hypothetical protein NIM87_07740 [Devosia sp. XJ19-1]|uniref:WsaF C-terminal domain-containing protein n=1 Tax=Devosia ureilytica TaxID=2952754 RepID=A0A9Q4AMB8_9HYPH|nr:hypothetical protein [Devosia ureilytica]MCP8883385.1 hypothetical protein [Devosia ureilytica]MCP8886247.1 hypothetical protein [Devosia ureilytica]